MWWPGLPPQAAGAGVQRCSQQGQPWGGRSLLGQRQLGVLTRRAKAVQDQEAGTATLQQLSSVPRAPAVETASRDTGKGSSSDQRSGHPSRGAASSGLKTEQGVGSSCSPLQPRCLTFEAMADTARASSSSMGGQAYQAASAPSSCGVGVSSKGGLDRMWNGELEGYADWQDYALLATLRQVAGGRATTTDLLLQYGLCITKGTVGRAVYDGALPLALQQVEEQERGEPISFTAMSVPQMDSMLNMAPLDAAAAQPEADSRSNDWVLEKYTLDSYPETAEFEQRLDALMKLPCLKQRLQAFKAGDRMRGFQMYPQLVKELEMAVRFTDGPPVSVISTQPQLPGDWVSRDGIITSPAGLRLPEAFAPLFSFWATMARYCNRVTTVDVNRVRSMTQHAGESLPSWGVRLQAAVDGLNAAAALDPTVESITSPAAGAIFLEGLTREYAEVREQQRPVIHGMGYGERTVQALVACLTTAWQGSGELGSETTKLRAMRGLSQQQQGGSSKSVSFQEPGGRHPSSHAEVRRLVDSLDGPFQRTAASHLQKKGFFRGSGEGAQPPAAAAMAAAAREAEAWDRGWGLWDSQDWGSRRGPPSAAWAVGAGRGAGWHSQQQQQLPYDYQSSAGEAQLQLGWYDSPPVIAAAAAAAGRGGPGRSYGGGRGSLAAGRGRGVGPSQGPPRWRPCGCTNSIHGDRVCFVTNPTQAPEGWECRYQPDRENWEWHCRQDGVPLPSSTRGAGAGRGYTAGGASGGTWRPPTGGGSSSSSGSGGRGAGGPGRTPFPAVSGVCCLVPTSGAGGAPAAAMSAAAAATRHSSRRESDAGVAAPAAAAAQVQTTVWVGILAGRDGDLADNVTRKEAGEQRPVLEVSAAAGQVAGAHSFHSPMAEIARRQQVEAQLKGQVVMSLPIKLPRDQPELDALQQRNGLVAAALQAQAGGGGEGAPGSGSSSSLGGGAGTIPVAAVGSARCEGAAAASSGLAAAAAGSSSSSSRTIEGGQLGADGGAAELSDEEQAAADQAAWKQWEQQQDEKEAAAWELHLEEMAAAEAAWRLPAGPPAAAGAAGAAAGSAGEGQWVEEGEVPPNALPFLSQGPDGAQLDLPDGRRALVHDAMLDTGSQVGIICLEFAKSIGLQPQPVPGGPKELQLATGQRAAVAQYFPGLTLVVGRGTDHEVATPLDWYGAAGLGALAQIIVPIQAFHAWMSGGIDHLTRRLKIRPHWRSHRDPTPVTLPIRFLRGEAAMLAAAVVADTFRQQPGEVAGAGAAGAASQQQQRQVEGTGTAGAASQQQQRQVEGAGTAGAASQQQQERVEGAGTAGAASRLQQEQVEGAGTASAASQLQHEQEEAAGTAGAASQLQQEQEEGAGTASQLQQEQEEGAGTAGGWQLPCLVTAVVAAGWRALGAMRAAAKATFRWARRPLLAAAATAGPVTTVTGTGDTSAEAAPPDWGALYDSAVAEEPEEATAAAGGVWAAPQPRCKRRHPGSTVTLRRLTVLLLLLLVGLVVGSPLVAAGRPPRGTMGQEGAGGASFRWPCAW
jgi:hypothetical protein